jgi:hypothetical protein
VVTLDNNLPDIKVTPRLIYKILVMANDSGDWDTDFIQAKLLALQLHPELEPSPAHEWDGDTVNSRLEALLQATLQHDCTQLDHGRPPLDVKPNLDQGGPLSDGGSKPPNVTLKQYRWGEHGGCDEEDYSTSATTYRHLRKLIHDQYSWSMYPPFTKRGPHALNSFSSIYMQCSS